MFILYYLDYPNMWGYVKEIYQLPGVAETVNMEHIVKHYHVSFYHSCTICLVCVVCR